MIRRETTLLRRGLGRRAICVEIVRRGCPRTRRTAVRMAAAGRPRWWIARALGIASTRVGRLFATDPVWSREIGGPGQ